MNSSKQWGRYAKEKHQHEDGWTTSNITVLLDGHTAQADKDFARRKRR